jgi:predicted dehydrogenase
MLRTTIGVIGAGRMGVRHARVLRQLAHVELVGIADVDEARAYSAGEIVGVPAFADAADLLDSVRPEAVVVATSANEHFESCRLALERRVAVLVEKPIATDLSEATKLVEMSEASATVLMPGHTLRFDSRYRMAVERVHEGEVGEVIYVTAKRTGAPRVDRAGAPSASLETAIHDIDIVQWLLGAAPVSVAAVCTHLQGAATRDAVFAVLRFPKGEIAALEASRAIPPGRPIAVDAQLEVVGSAGAIWLRGGDTGIESLSRGIVEYPNIEYQGWDGEQALNRELSAFVAAVRGEQEQPISGREGVAALRTALAVDRAARSGEVVILD